ncbi:MAG: carotenoid biosynthesis protein [Bacteroidota bacterium]
MSNHLTLEQFKRHKKLFSIIVIWLFQVSGIVGISLGFEDWFITKTPLNLTIVTVLLLWNYPLNSPFKIIIALIFFSAGMMAEWIGVHYDFLFGAYHYGDNLGIKIDGVPIIIGLNWAILALITGTIARNITKHQILQIVFGALLMVFLDFFLEVSAPKFDFWYWQIGHAPVRNFITWFLLAALLQWILQSSKIIGNLSFSVHLYLAQLTFLMYFYGYHQL